MTTLLGAYPLAAMVKCSNGKFQGLYPAILKAKTDIGAGKLLHSDGYQIEAKRTIKAGESFSVLAVGDGLLSIEVAERATKDSDGKPWFTAFKDDMKPNDRTCAIEAWRIEKEHVGK